MKEHLLLCRLLCSILLLSALTCKTIADSTSNPTLPPEQVEAINALLPRTSKLDNDTFSKSDCNNKLTDWVYCDCNDTMCNVTGLDLSSTGLKGEIPKEIGKLTSLTRLYLDDNKFRKIPSWLQNLSMLSTISLSANNFDGPIPEFGAFSSLRKLDLSDNNFNGPIPPDLGALPSLLVLALGGNLLSGQIPSQLGSLSNLWILWLANNNFSGNLRQSFDQLKDMRSFDIHGNNFNGQIPAFIAQWKNIWSLYLMGNNFEWPVDHGVFQSFQSLTKLEILQLADITGSPRDFPIVNNQSLSLTHL